MPFITGCLVWLQRDELRKVPISCRPWLGGAVVALGLVMLLAGRASSTNLAEEISIIVTLSGLILLLFGQQMFRKLLFPIAYLLSMIPFWEFLTERLHLPFQLYSAAIGVGTLRLFDIPVIKDGILIELPNITLEVAEACSGINYLIAVLCIGIPMTYLHVTKWWKRIVILFVSIVIAILSNGARVAMVSLFAYHGIRGPDGDVHGPFSLLRSMFVSGIGFVVLFWLVSRFGDKPESASALTSPHDPISPRPTAGGPAMKPLLVAVTMLVVTVGLEAWRPAETVPAAINLSTFPGQIGGWRADWTPSFSNDVGQLDFDEKLSRNYAGPDGTELNLFVGYYRRQTDGRELADHRFREVFGALRYAPSNAEYRQAGSVKDFLMTQGDETYHVTYWYALNGQRTSEPYRAKLYTAWNALIHRNNSGGIVVVKALVDPRESLPHTRQRLGGFIDELSTVTAQYLP